MLNKDERMENEIASESEVKILHLREALTMAFGAILMMFMLYTSATSPLSPLLQRSLTLLLVVYIAVLVKPMKGRIGIAVDTAIFIGATISLGYVICNWKTLAYRTTYEPVMFEVFLGFLLVVILLELSRRSIGWPLTIISLLALIYARFGNFLPATIAHKGYSLTRLISNQYLTTVGIFGTMTGTLATTISPFVLFGSFLSVAGVGKLMIDTASLVARNSRGGPAKMAVIASGLFGMVSGSSSSNVMTTGSITIPLMKGIGYEKTFAGAVEAAASTGGQIMPPIMGVAAFLMSYVTGIPYITIAIAAVIPATFYFISIYLAVDFEARRIGLKPVGGESDVTLMSILKRSYLFIPFMVLVVLLMKNWSPAKSAFWATAITALLSQISSDSRTSWSSIKRVVYDYAKSMPTVSMACATAGVIIGALNLTGATLRLTYFFVRLAGGNLFLMMLFVAILCIILGMGLPTPAAYSVAASFAAQALVDIGVSTIAAHLFILFYASLSSITPPVALAAYAAASISGGNPIKTGFIAWRLALVGFVVPFMFVYGPELLIGESSNWGTIQAIISGLIGIFFMSVSVIGFFKTQISAVERALFLVAGCMMIYPGTLSDLIGFSVGGVLLSLHFILAKRMGAGKSLEEPTSAQAPS
ncbi:MAG TPA: TRAP transporter fused permease subunit [Firmicutes bacterium]|nr:TRAP transporter fused permease subunit [Bacillota bacterium]